MALTCLHYRTPGLQGYVEGTVGASWASRGIRALTAAAPASLYSVRHNDTAPV